MSCSRKLWVKQRSASDKMLKWMELFRKSRESKPESAENALFQEKYRHFQSLLAGNNNALELIADLEQVCYGAKPFTLESIIGRVERLMAQVYDIAEELGALSGGKFPTLRAVVEQIGAGIFEELLRKRSIEGSNSYHCAPADQPGAPLRGGRQIGQPGRNIQSRPSAGAGRICRDRLCVPLFYGIKRAFQAGGRNPQGH